MLEVVFFHAYFLRVFIIKWVFNLLKTFSASVEMIIWFISFSLLICCITVIDLYILNNPCISGINPTSIDPPFLMPSLLSSLRPGTVNNSCWTRSQERHRVETRCPSQQGMPSHLTPVHCPRLPLCTPVLSTDGSLPSASGHIPWAPQLGYSGEEESEPEGRTDSTDGCF